MTLWTEKVIPSDIPVYYLDNDVCIIHSDCRAVLPFLGSVDSIVTDPPYGIGYSTKEQGYKGALDFAVMHGDEDEGLVSWLLTSLPQSDRNIIWGANNWPQLLPYPGTWVVWDKRVDERSDAGWGWPFELGWVSRRKGKGHIYRIKHGGVINADQVGQPRVHPTQKPVALFLRLLQDYPASIILDPFMGSGTTLVAAQMLGIKAIGIEMEEKYCAIARRRVQVKPLFVEPVNSSQQQGLWYTEV